MTLTYTYEPAVHKRMNTKHMVLLYAVHANAWYSASGHGMVDGYGYDGQQEYYTICDPSL